MKDYNKMSYVMTLDSETRKARKSQKHANKAKRVQTEKKERKTNYMNLYYTNRF